MTSLVTGANRGIGLEFVRQLSARGDRVHAAVREPLKAHELQSLAKASGGLVQVHRCDVTRDDDVAALARDVNESLDLLLNGAGVMGSETPLARLDLAEVTHTFEVNAVGPLRVTRALLPALRRAKGSKVVHLTSKMGSITDNRSGGAYAYRMSKAALNMASRSLAVDLEVDGVLSVVMHPGWVQTDMGGPHAPLTVEQSVSSMLDVIDRLERSDSGGFFDYAGRLIPW